MKKMTEKQMLDWAKIKYPNGTRIETITTSYTQYQPDEMIGTIHWDNMKTYHHTAIVCDEKRQELFLGIEEKQGDLRLLIYNKGKWAKIIDNPEILNKAREIIYGD